MLTLILLLSTIWPLSLPSASQPVPVVVPDLLCTQAGDNWFYFGTDGATGIGASCTEAFHDWKQTPPPHVIYYTV
jgi:hypothetical protein